MTLNELLDDFLKEVREAGINVPERNGQPSVALAYDNVRGTEQEKKLARLVCRFTSMKEWKSAGGGSFYQTNCWLRARYLTLAEQGNKCQCCGAGPSEGAVLHVDHIKPRSKHPELALSLENLQVLCGDCNTGKSNLDDTDWRR